MTVKRYTPLECLEHESEYVTCQDYEELQERMQLVYSLAKVMNHLLPLLEEEYKKLVTENAALHGRIDSVIGIIENSDNRYCMCGATIESHKLGGCGSPMGVFDYRYNSWIKDFMETPATDAAIAEMRNEWKAQGVDDFAECAYTIEHHDHAKAFAANLRAGRKG